MFKDFALPDIATYALAVCAVVLTGNTVLTNYRSSHPESTKPLTTIDEWQTFAADGHSSGAARPTVTVVVFSDYQCPVCLRMDRELRRLSKEHPADLRVVWRHFPLTGHPYARPAAIAAECAGLQHRFAQYHEDLFDHASQLGKLPWANLAVNSGLPDTVAFNRCVRDSSVVSVVDRDIAAGNELGVFGTPTVLVDNEEYVGVPWDFSAIVERHINARVRG